LREFTKEKERTTWGALGEIWLAKTGLIKGGSLGVKLQREKMS